MSTSTGLFINLFNLNYKNKQKQFDSYDQTKVRVFDYRISKYENYKEIVNVISSIMFNLRQTLNIFIYRENTKNWQRVIEKDNVKRFITHGPDRLDLFQDNFEKGTNL